MNKHYKKQTRKKIKGGLKKKNPDLTSWQAVYKMITTPEAKLSLLSYDSLKGFIFRIDVPTDNPDNSEFLGLNYQGTAFNVPIYSLVLKIVLIRDNDRDQKLESLQIDDKYITKETERMMDIVREAQIQQLVYVKTLNPAGKPICLGVVDFSYFDQTASRRLLDTLLQIPGNDQFVQHILIYLIRNLNNGRKLGIISMELADKREYTVLHRISDNEIINEGCKRILAEIVILFVKCKIIHYDLHSSNVLIRADGQKAFIIDFGRVIHFQPNLLTDLEKKFAGYYLHFTDEVYVQDREMIVSDKPDNMIEITDFYNMLGDEKETDADAVDILCDIFKFISSVDYSIKMTKSTRPMYRYRRPQMLRFLQYVYPNISTNWYQHSPYFLDSDEHDSWYITEEVRAKCLTIIPIIIELTKGRIGSRNLFSMEAIKRNIRNGNIYFIHRDFRVPSFNKSLEVPQLTPGLGLGPVAAPPGTLFGPMPVAAPPGTLFGPAPVAVQRPAAQRPALEQGPVQRQVFRPALELGPIQGPAAQRPALGPGPLRQSPQVPLPTFLQGQAPQQPPPKQKSHYFTTPTEIDNSQKEKDAELLKYVLGAFDTPPSDHKAGQNLKMKTKTYKNQQKYLKNKHGKKNKTVKNKK
jgi:hypothetical protein